MSLRRGARLLVLLTGTLAILGQWDLTLARWWHLGAGALLLGLACEAAALGRRPVKLRSLAPQSLRLGRPEQLRLAFHQDARARMTIEVALAAPDEIAATARIEKLALPRGLDRIATLECVGRRLGRYRWPAPALRVAGPLGLAWWPRQVEVDSAVTVVPDILARGGDTHGSQAAGAQRALVAGGGTEIRELREYRPGDPWRAIDWKASARRHRLISREMSEEQHLELLVAIDAGRASGLAAGEIDRLGLYVNVALRIARRAADLDDSVGVLVYASRPLAVFQPARGEAAVARIRALLSACRVQPGESNPVLAAARVRAMSARRCLVVLLTALEDASTTEQLVQAVRLMRPKHFVFVAGVESARIASLALATTADPLGPFRALAAIDYGNAVAANVRTLRALGAAALSARPELLDRAVLDAYRRFRERRQV